MSRLFEIHHKGSTYRFGESELPLTIGSSADTHIYLPEVMAIEAYIGDSKGFLFLQPAETKTPKYHNGQHVQTSTWIKSGDTTRIGSTLLHYIISGDLVEIHVGEVDDKKVLIPPDSPHPDAGEVNEVLPRIAKDLNARILILQGERDYQITMEDFEDWKKALKKKKQVSTHMSYSLKI